LVGIGLFGLVVCSVGGVWLGVGGVFGVCLVVGVGLVVGGVVGGVVGVGLVLMGFIGLMILIGLVECVLMCSLCGVWLCGGLVWCIVGLLLVDVVFGGMDIDSCCSMWSSRVP